MAGMFRQHPHPELTVWSWEFSNFTESMVGIFSGMDQPMGKSLSVLMMPGLMLWIVATCSHSSMNGVWNAGRFIILWAQGLAGVRITKNSQGIKGDTWKVIIIRAIPVGQQPGSILNVPAAGAGSGRVRGFFTFPGPGMFFVVLGAVATENPGASKPLHSMNGITIIIKRGTHGIQSIRET